MRIKLETFHKIVEMIEAMDDEPDCLFINDDEELVCSWIIKNGN